MSYLSNPAKREQRRGGFTLVEVMMVVAIIGIMTALSMVAYDALGRRGALQNASFDLQGVLSAARTRASSAGYPVWVVFYPKGSHGMASGGPGAFLVVEDSGSNYVRNPLRLFSLPFEVEVTPGGNMPAAGGVSAVHYLADYGKVRFEALTPGRTDVFGAPFSGLPVQTCSFCSGAGSPSGAIGFYPDGSAHFVDGSGQWITTTNQSLAFSGVDGHNQYLFAISGPSGYMASFSPDNT